MFLSLREVNVSAAAFTPFRLQDGSKGGLIADFWSGMGVFKSEVCFTASDVSLFEKSYGVCGSIYTLPSARREQRGLDWSEV